MYTEQTGEPLTAGGAWTVERRALRKMRKAWLALLAIEEGSTTR